MTPDCYINFLVICCPLFSFDYCPLLTPLNTLLFPSIPSKTSTSLANLLLRVPSISQAWFHVLHFFLQISNSVPGPLAGKHHSGLSGKKSNVLEEEQKTKIEKGIEDGKGREGKEEKEEKDGGGAGNGIYKYFHFTRCSKRVAERKRTSSTFARVSTG